MPTLAALTIYAFGLTAFAAGIMHLLSPSSATASLGLPDSCMPATNGNSLAAIAMGIYYTLAAYQENRTFFYLTVPMRMLTSTVFWSQGGNWKMASIWEGGGATITALALYFGS
ncbi:uncharacterized protein LY89DRAFT_674577 [Mollisia scopiformis]|uniref:Uncharacterized protein n=1 Tax=Mollisia scopiformis TaxID=149040 RepID=A0A194WUF3_MOLSC|nr:uncharacterized protein LY89DRAFT_674577 [Mollisia scopiformis]KUJ11242.1 hypothetical protein LY89DRAFT_674577 [Mollisia scopiformis]